MMQKSRPAQFGSSGLIVRLRRHGYGALSTISAQRSAATRKRRRRDHKGSEDIRENGGHARNRTGVYGFAVRCVTTPPRGPSLERYVRDPSLQPRTALKPRHDSDAVYSKANRRGQLAQRVEFRPVPRAPSRPSDAISGGPFEDPNGMANADWRRVIASDRCLGPLQTERSRSGEEVLRRAR